MASTPTTATAGSPAPKPFQFSLRQLLIATSLCAAMLAAVMQFGSDALPCVFFLASVGMFLYGATHGKRWMALGLAGLGTTAWCLLLLPAVTNPRTAARRSLCSSNLKQVVLALHNYHDVYGTFPPAYIADAQGQPLHSWRVLILPYMERPDLYARYNFNEPWNGPNNRKLLAEMPREFGCPSEPGPLKGRTETSYLAVIGPGTVWPGDKAVSLSQILDGASNTLLVVEVHDSGISWLEPRDLYVTQMPLAINSPRGQGINSRHGSRNDKGPGNVASVVYCDGSTRFLPSTLSPKSLRALLTIAGGETVDGEDD